MSERKKYKEYREQGKSVMSAAALVLFGAIRATFSSGKRY